MDGLEELFDGRYEEKAKPEEKWVPGIKVTIEITDFDTLALLLEFLVQKGFKIKSKDDQTLVREKGARHGDKKE